MKMSCLYLSAVLVASRLLWSGVRGGGGGIANRLFSCFLPCTEPYHAPVINGAIFIPQVMRIVVGLYHYPRREIVDLNPRVRRIGGGPDPREKVTPNFNSRMTRCSQIRYQGTLKSTRSEKIRLAE